MKLFVLMLAAALPLASCVFPVDNRHDGEPGSQVRSGGDMDRGDDRSHDRDSSHCDKDGVCDQPRGR